MTHGTPPIQVSGLQVQPPQPAQRVGELRLNPSAQDFVPKTHHSFFTSPQFGAPMGTPTNSNPRDFQQLQFQNTTPIFPVKKRRSYASVLLPSPHSQMKALSS